MAQKKWENEVEIGQAVVAHLRAQGWTVYPELEDIDIIAVKDDPNALRGKKIIGIECKKQFNLKVIEQAYNRRYKVDEAWVAVPGGHSSNNAKNYTYNNAFGTMLCDKIGVGVLSVTKRMRRVADYQYDWVYECKVDHPAAPGVRKVQYVDALLDPEAEHFQEPGRCGGGQWTKFRRTVTRLEEYVASHPGCEAAEALKAIPHHYKKQSTANSCLMKFLKGGKVIKKVRYEQGKLYPRDHSHNISN